MNGVGRDICAAFCLLSLGACGPTQSANPESGYASTWVHGSPPPPATPPTEPSAPDITDADLAALPRDERRTRIIEGFVCHRQLQGQSGYVRYEPGGLVRVGHQEGDVQLRWKVENDRLCIASGAFDERCHDLPKQDIPNEREVFLAALGKSCL